MNTTLSKRGQTVVPAQIRKRYNMQEGDRLAWIDTGEGIKVIPIPADPLEALIGCARGENLLEALYRYRKEERDRENP
ncbi:MAG: AbrB/MazE/SpoVT family DNA-binding domain-containing protein [Chloroflexi bacterium]|nr:AbrB/MazE/SpoVT family DNA-binding domain-containing protein [Chloroflexota bacterium]